MLPSLDQIGLENWLRRLDPIKTSMHFNWASLTDVMMMPETTWRTWIGIKHTAKVFWVFHMEWRWQLAQSMEEPDL